MRTKQNYELRRRQFFETQLAMVNENPNNPSYRVLKARLQNVLTYFNREQARVAPGSEEETALKERFRNLYKNFIDAGHNCIDQVISQIETFAIDVAVQANTAQEIPVEQRLFNLTCIALHNYRKTLMTGILAFQDRERAKTIVEAIINNDDDAAVALAMDAGFTEEDEGEEYNEQGIRNMFAQTRNDIAQAQIRAANDPNDEMNPAHPQHRPLQEFAGRFTHRFLGLHMADWQRIAMRKLAKRAQGDLGVHGGLAHLRPAFNNTAKGKERVRLAMVDFEAQYKPEVYLLTNIAQPPQGEVVSPVNTLLTQWAKKHYALDAEYQANYPNDATKLDETFCDQEEGFGALTMGGVLTPAGCAFLMEQAGLIAPRAEAPI